MGFPVALSFVGPSALKNRWHCVLGWSSSPSDRHGEATKVQAGA